MRFGFASSANRWRALVMGAWATGLTVLLIAGRYSLFIRARLWPLLLASLVILLLFLLAMMVRPAHAGSGRIRLATWVRGGMLLLPLLYMSNLISGAGASGLNSYAMAKRFMGYSDSMAIIGSDSGPATTGNGAVNLGFIARHLNRLVGTHVVTEGRVYRDDSLPAGQIAIFRFIVVCCAADAMPVEVVVNSPNTAACKNDEWIQVGGMLHKDDKGVAVIDADQIAPIAAPAEPYLSPYQF